MPKVSSRHNRQAGFSVIEVVLAAATFALIVTSLFGAYYYGEVSLKTAGNRQRAVLYAEEGLEAVRNIRDNSFQNLVDGTYGLAINNGVWNLQGSTDTNSIFTRTVTISSLDVNTKQITSVVTWRNTLQRTGRVALLSHLTNWAGQQSWVTPTLGSCLNISGGQDAQKIDLKGTQAYIVTDSASASFVSISVADPAFPHQTSAIGLQNNPRNLFVLGNYAYISSRNNSQELQVINIQNPDSVSQVGSFDAAGNGDGNGIYVVNNTAYMAREAGTEEFHTLNVTQPTTPSQLGQRDLTSTANEVYVSGNYAYLASANDSQELTVINISNPASPTVAGSYNLPGTADATTITGFGNSVALGRSDGRVHILSVSTPASPQLVGTYTGTGVVNDLDVGISNTRLFVVGSNPSAEFLVLNITDPTTPQVLGTYNAPGVLNGVKYSSSQNAVYVVGSSNSGNFCSLEAE